MRKLRLAAGLMVFLVMLHSGSVEAGNEDTYISEEIVGSCVQIGEEDGLCPEILMALIERESSGDPKATNGSCKGLCQISEKWHRDRMKRLGVTDIYDPEGNIRLAADYLMELADQYEDIGLVLMVYHGEKDAEQKAEEGRISEYATFILERAEQLERLHGK